MILLDSKTKSLIQRLQPTAPVNITAIAKVLGCAVWESGDLPDGIAGKIFRDEKYGGERQFSIVVRAQDQLVRKRFTVAHELAHFLLHKHLFGAELVDNTMYRSKLSTPIEAQANGLAADLLMPWHLITPIVGRPLSELANTFQVSEEAMKIRLSSKGFAIAV